MQSFGRLAEGTFLISSTWLPSLPQELIPVNLKREEVMEEVCPGGVGGPPGPSHKAAPNCRGQGVLGRVVPAAQSTVAGRAGVSWTAGHLCHATES